MPNYLLCSNPGCRLIIDLEGCKDPVDLEEIGIENCPECKSSWTSRCPFCVQAIAVNWNGHHAHCGHCQRRFYAKAA